MTAPAVTAVCCALAAGVWTGVGWPCVGAVAFGLAVFHGLSALEAWDARHGV